MTPPISHPCWIKLVTGESQPHSSNLSFNMLIFNVRLRYKNDSTRDNMTKLVRRAYDFFVKYETTLRTEVNALIS
jgi:hypothetical protein